MASSFQGRSVTVFGGSGFIGRYVVKRLAAEGARVRVAVRDAEKAKFLKPMGAVGQIAPFRVNVGNEALVRQAVEGTDDVINLVGILAESGSQSFRGIQAEAPGIIAEAAKAAGVEGFVQMSAIGANADSDSKYAKSKAMGEAAVKAAMPNATILRPSVVFGPEDDFFNRFAAMARLAPALPLIDGGKTKFQPVYVGDVADAVIAALKSEDAAGKTYELGGPHIMTFKEVLEYVMAETGRKRLLLPMPSALFRPIAGLMECVPGAPITRDQLIQLESDYVVAEGADGLDALGISPTGISAVAPSYLVRFRDGGQFARDVGA
jgi:NADH dehydrogenase